MKDAIAWRVAAPHHLAGLLIYSEEAGRPGVRNSDMVTLNPI